MGLKLLDWFRTILFESYQFFKLNKKRLFLRPVTIIIIYLLQYQKRFEIYDNLNVNLVRFKSILNIVR